MPPGQEQKMDGRSRRRIFDGEQVVVFVDFHCRRPLGNDIAENTCAHNMITAETLTFSRRFLVGA